MSSSAILAGLLSSASILRIFRFLSLVYSDSPKRKVSAESVFISINFFQLLEHISSKRVIRKDKAIRIKDILRNLVKGLAWLFKGCFIKGQSVRYQVK